MNFNKLNKNIVYCKHSYLKGNFRTLQFDEKLNEWKSIIGLQKELIYRIPVIFHHMCDKCGYISKLNLFES